jgi:hypothetical protein
LGAGCPTPASFRRRKASTASGLNDFDMAVSAGMFNSS